MSNNSKYSCIYWVMLFLTLLITSGVFAQEKGVSQTKLDSLIQVLSDETIYEWRRQEATRKLGETNDPRAVPALIREANKGFLSPREALGKINHPKAVDVLTKEFDNANSDVQVVIVNILKKRGDRRAIPCLTKALNAKTAMFGFLQLRPCTILAITRVCLF